MVFEEGDPGDAYHVVFDGAVEMVKAGSGDAEGKLAVRRGGEGFGEMALLYDDPRSATARVVEETRPIEVHFSARRRAEERDRTAELGRALQRGLLPRNAPKVEGYEIAAGTSLDDDGEGRIVWDSVPVPGGGRATVSLHVVGREAVDPWARCSAGAAPTRSFRPTARPWE